MSADLKIITGSGRHSTKGVPLLLPRIQRLLSEEFELRYDYDKRLVCDERDCKTHLNRGCLVVQLQERFRHACSLRRRCPPVAPPPPPPSYSTRAPYWHAHPFTAYYLAELFCYPCWTNPSPNSNQELFRYLSETRPYETYVVTLPEGGR